MVVVAAEGGGGGVVGGRGFGKVALGGFDHGLAVDGVVEGDEVAAVRQLRVGEGHLAGLDGVGGDIDGLQDAFGLEGGALLGPLGDGGLDLVARCAARFGVGVALVAAQLGAADRCCEAAPVVVVADGDRYPLVVAGGGEDAVGEHLQVVVADQRGDAAINGVVEQGGAHEVERRFGLSLVDVTAFAGTVAVIERGEQGGYGEAGAEIVGIGRVGADGVAAGRAGEGDKAPDRGAHRAKAGDAGERAVLPEEAGAKHDQIGLDFAQRFVVQPPAAHGAGGERLAEDVAPADEVEQHLARLFGGEVERESEFVDVHVAEEAGVVDALFVVMEGADAAGGFDAVGALDAHDGCAEVGEQAGSGRTGNDPHEVEYFDAVERAWGGVSGHQITPSAASEARRSESISSSA